MKKKENKQDFPFTKGCNVKKEDANNFDVESRVAEVVKGELDLNLALNWIGQQYYDFSQAAKRVAKKFEFIAQTENENELEQKQALRNNLQDKANTLGYVDKSKVRISAVLVILSMLSESVIYTNIGQNVFGLHLEEAILLACLVLVFVKYIGTIVSPYVLEYLKGSTLKVRTIQKTMLFVLVFATLLNSTFIGIVNLTEIQRKKKIEQMAFLTSSIAEIEEYEGNTNELQKELNSIQAELNEKENGFFYVAKFIAIALLGLLSISCGAVIYALFEFQKSSLKLKNSIAKLRDRKVILKTNLPYFINSYEQLISIQKQLIMLMGEKHFLETLLSKEKEEQMKLNTVSKP